MTHKTKIGHKNQFRQSVSRIVRRISTKPDRHIFTINAHFVSSLDAKVKDAGYMRLKIALDACQRHHSPACWLE